MAEVLKKTVKEAKDMISKVLYVMPCLWRSACAHSQDTLLWGALRLKYKMIISKDKGAVNLGSDPSFRYSLFTPGQFTTIFIALTQGYGCSIK